MTNRHKKRLAAILLREIGGLEGERAVERLFELGLVNLRVCEQRAIRGEIERLAAEGVPRCEAMHATAGNCSAVLTKKSATTFTTLTNPES